MKVILVSFTVLLSCSFDFALAEGFSQTAEDKANLLYTTLRKIALPTKTGKDVGSTTSRFLLLMPGIPLSYSEYYPGADYSNFILNYDASMKEAVVPPHVMEKWFDLTDDIPNFDPLNGQSTGKSLANIYSDILHEMKLKTLVTPAAKSAYNQSVSYLSEIIIDPSDPSSSVARLTLYERYRDLYFKQKLEMDNIIENKRETVQALEYELWFQRIYPSLQAKVESAYTQWLIFGQKEAVEVYLANLDSGSSALKLEEARMALRAAGVTSLDRTRTIYPVAFEPADWYKYLLPRDQKLSRDQLNNMLGKVSAKLQIIEAMLNQHTNSSLRPNNTTNRDVFKHLDSNLTRYLKSEQNCLQNSSGCATYESSRNSLIQNFVELAGEFSLNQFKKYYQSDDSYVEALKAQNDQLQNLYKVIVGRLGTTEPYLGALLDDPALTIDTFEDVSDDTDNWMQFEFYSESHESIDSYVTSHESVSGRTGIFFGLFYAGGSASYQKDTSDFSEQLSQSKMRVKGEMLRVNIKRPWFKPELFDIAEISYEESVNDQIRYVSPGRDMKESDFYKSVTKTGSIRYILPEYTTSFLLARKIEMEFDNITSSVVTSTMNEMSHAGGGGGFLFFHVSASYTKSKTLSSVSVKRTADGMKISVPGTQMIGYFTEVLPKFPSDQKSR